MVRSLKEDEQCTDELADLEDEDESTEGTRKELEKQGRNNGAAAMLKTSCTPAPG